jgi:RecJ-like exonuclease
VRKGLSLTKINDTMNKKIFTMALLTAAVSFTACKKETTTETTTTEVTDTTTIPEPVAEDTATATTEAPAQKDGEAITVTGKVTEINQGKDGYTAKIEAADGKKYSATISIPNLADPKQYRAVKAGDEITVTGEVTNLEDDVLIRVKELK